MSTQVELS